MFDLLLALPLPALLLHSGLAGAPPVESAPLPLQQEPSPVAAATDTPPLPVAILKSGKRVPCLPGTEAGSATVETPYGILHTALDPVAEVVDGSGEAAMLRRVRKHDPERWAQRVSERGLLAELVGATDAAIKAEPKGNHHLSLALLESWGQEFDSIPRKVKADKRVEFLWHQLTRCGASRGALYTGELLREIPGPTASFKQRVSLVQLRRGLRSQNPVVSRAAAVLAQHQGENDMLFPLVDASLADPWSDVRLASAHSLFELDERQALGRWTLALWRDHEESRRIQAAEHIGEFGKGQAAIDALIYPLAASGYQAPGSYTFFGRQITIVGDFDVEVAQAAAIADPIVNVIQEGVALQVRVLGTHMVRTLVNSLQRVTGANPGPRAEDWLRWYREQQAKTTP
ncbi:MAG: hypothetical protein DWQ01_10565 [Planctomycetota bacterium]|nr:MAG: hypothetical protein DWQ01_10565 [Planctomycetota bacterium]